MIQKLKNSEYLKRFGNMQAAERQAYIERVGEWLKKSATLLHDRVGESVCSYQNILSVSVSWNDSECKAFTDGAILLSALIGETDCWLPDLLYTKAAKRCIHHIIATLYGFTQEYESNATDEIKTSDEGVGEDKEAQDNESEVAPGTEDGGTKEDETDKAEQTLPAPATQPVKRGRGRPRKGEERNPVVEHIPATVRPKHIDQYVHLLPMATQERASHYGEYMKQLDFARQQMLLLVENGQEGKVLEQWAKKATQMDDKRKTILGELDREWKRLVKKNNVCVDALGNAYIVTDNGGTTHTKAEEDKDDVADEYIERITKYLRDKRPRITDKHINLWQIRYRELIHISGKGAVTDAIREAAKHYGIDINKL